MVTMHGFFDLKNETEEAHFKAAYDAFGRYLQEQALITSYRSMRRSPSENYDSNPPETKYYVSIDFHNLEQAQACWDVIEAHDETSAKLHRQVFAKIKDYTFFLSKDIPC